MSPRHHGQGSTLLSAAALSSPFTFSSTTRGGRSTLIPVAMCDQMPVRVPSRNPLRSPAWLTSWQGNPAVSTSTRGTCAQSSFVRSP